MARLLEVGYRMALMPSAGEGYRNEWESLVAAAGSASGFEAKFDETFRQRDVETWLLFDRENPSSVASCVETARQNGRAVRTALTTEMWDALNGAYLDLREIERRPRSENPLPQLCDWTKRQAALFRGATEGTHLQNDGYDFLNLGLYLERGDNTARLLDVKYYVLLPTTDMVGGSIDTYQWTTLLRALSSLPRLPLELRRRVQPAQDRAFPDPQPLVPAVAAALPRQGRLPPRPAGAGLRQADAGARPAARLARRARRRPDRRRHRGGAARVHQPLHPPERDARPRRGGRLPVRGPVMRLKVRHATVYSYGAPMRFVTQSHRLTPAPNAGQAVLDWAVSAEGAAVRRRLHRRRRRPGHHDDGAGTGRAHRGRRRGHGRDQRHRRRAARAPRDRLAAGLPAADRADPDEPGAARPRGGGAGRRRQRAARPGAPLVGGGRATRSPTSRARPTTRPPRPRRWRSGAASARTWRTR